MMNVKPIVNNFPRKTAIAAFLLLVVLFGAQAGGDEEAVEEPSWLQWRGPNGDGISLETDWDPEALAGGAKFLWTAKVGVGYSNVAIQEGRLYTMGMLDREEQVLCLDAATGEEIWRFSCEDLGSSGPQSTPAVDGNRVYGLSSEGTLVCLKANNGRLLWRRHLERDFEVERPRYGFAASPVVDGELLLLNANSQMIGVDTKHGDLVWSVGDSVPRQSWGSYSTNIMTEIEGKRCALFVGPSTLRAVEVKTGRELWAYEHGDSMHPVADPIVFGGRGFFSLSGSCVMLEITETEVERLWTSTELNSVLSNPVLVGGCLYGTHWPVEVHVSSHNWGAMFFLDWPFRCVDWETGEVRWEQSMKSASVTAAGNFLILLEMDGTLRIVEASPLSFVERSSADLLPGNRTGKIFATPPVLLDGKIYCRDHIGELFCIDVSR